LTALQADSARTLIEAEQTNAWGNSFELANCQSLAALTVMSALFAMTFEMSLS
jgi:hypothetical protein